MKSNSRAKLPPPSARAVLMASPLLLDVERKDLRRPRGIWLAPHHSQGLRVAPVAGHHGGAAISAGSGTQYLQGRVEQPGLIDRADARAHHETDLRQSLFFFLLEQLIVGRIPPELGRQHLLDQPQE